MPKRLTNQDEKLCEAVLKIVAAHGWKKVSFENISKSAKIPARLLSKRFKSTADLLPLLVRYITEQAIKQSGKPSQVSPPHDRLFEVMMARFDVLNKHRNAILSIMEAARRDSRLLFILVPAQIEAMKSTLDRAGLRGSKQCTSLRPVALWAGYAATTRVWAMDETLDMSKTMAALDKFLRLADRAARIFRTDFVL